jgi:hypothetical protein
MMTTTAKPDLMSIYERAANVATVPCVSASLGGWSAKAQQIDVTGYSQQYVESAPHDPANLMFVMVTNDPNRRHGYAVSEITEAQFDRFAAIGYEPGSNEISETDAIRRALAIAESVAPCVGRHQQGGRKEKAGGYVFE